MSIEIVHFVGIAVVIPSLLIKIGVAIMIIVGVVVAPVPIVILVRNRGWWRWRIILSNITCISILVIVWIGHNAVGRVRGGSRWNSWWDAGLHNVVHIVITISVHAHACGKRTRNDQHRENRHHNGNHRALVS